MKYLAESLDILKTQEIMNVKLFCPPNGYILYFHGGCGLFTLYLKGNGMKNPKNGKYWILYMYNIVPQCKILNYGLKWEVRGIDWLYFSRNK